MVTTMATVRLTQQQYQQFIDRISGLEARMATLQTHAEAQKEQTQMAEVVSNSCGQIRRIRLHRFVLRSTRETIPSTMIGLSVRDESSQQLTRDLRDYCSGFLDRSTK